MRKPSTDEADLAVVRAPELQRPVFYCGSELLARLREAQVGNFAFDHAVRTRRPRDSPRVELSLAVYPGYASCVPVDSKTLAARAERIVLCDVESLNLHAAYRSVLECEPQSGTAWIESNEPDQAQLRRPS